MANRLTRTVLRLVMLCASLSAHAWQFAVDDWANNKALNVPSAVSTYVQSLSSWGSYKKLNCQLVGHQVPIGPGVTGYAVTAAQRANTAAGLEGCGWTKSGRGPLWMVILDKGAWRVVHVDDVHHFDFAEWLNSGLYQLYFTRFWTAPTERYFYNGTQYVRIVDNVNQCKVVNAKCTDSTSYRNVGGHCVTFVAGTPNCTYVPVEGNCWSWKYEYQCQDEIVDNCAPLKNIPLCKQESITPVPDSINAFGKYDMWEAIWNCSGKQTVDQSVIDLIGQPVVLSDTIDESQCNQWKYNPGCYLQYSLVIEGAQTRTIDGVSVYKDWWKMRYHYVCQTQHFVDYCAPLKAAGCTESMLPEPVIVNPVTKAVVSANHYYSCTNDKLPADPNIVVLNTTYTVRETKDDLAACKTYIDSGCYLVEEKCKPPVVVTPPADGSDVVIPDHCERTYACLPESALVSECNKYTNDPNCRLQQDQCIESFESGAFAGQCKYHKKTYLCQSEPGEDVTVLNCANRVMCLQDGTCFDTPIIPDKDWRATVTTLEINRQIGMMSDPYWTKNTPTIFKGKLLECGTGGSGIINCCKQGGVPNREEFSDYVMRQAISSAVMYGVGVAAGYAGGALIALGSSITAVGSGTTYAVLTQSIGASLNTAGTWLMSYSSSGTQFGSGLSTIAEYVSKFFDWLYTGTVNVMQSVGIIEGGSATAGGGTATAEGGAAAQGASSTGNTIFSSVGFWAIVIMLVIYGFQSAQACNEEEHLLSNFRGVHNENPYFGDATVQAKANSLGVYGIDGLCLFLGTYQKKGDSWEDAIGFTRRKEVYCCYPSLLARTIQYQGRMQLNQRFRTWDLVDSPKYKGEAGCPGLTTAELERIDFSKLDLGEFIDIVQANVQKQIEGNALPALNRLKARVDQKDKYFGNEASMREIKGDFYYEFNQGDPAMVPDSLKEGK